MNVMDNAVMACDVVTARALAIKFKQMGMVNRVARLGAATLATGMKVDSFKQLPWYVREALSEALNDEDQARQIKDAYQQQLKVTTET